MFELAKNAVNKNSIVSKIFLEKTLKFFLRYWFLSLKTTVLLMALLNHCFIKKQSGQKDLIWSISFGGFEMVFLFLVETIKV